MSEAKLFWLTFLCIALFVTGLVGFSILGKYQMCKTYFSEINVVGCMVTRLPGFVSK